MDEIDFRLCVRRQPLVNEGLHDCNGAGRSALNNTSWHFYQRLSVVCLLQFTTSHTRYPLVTCPLRLSGGQLHNGLDGAWCGRSDMKLVLSLHATCQSCVASGSGCPKSWRRGLRQRSAASPSRVHRWWWSGALSRPVLCRSPGCGNFVGARDTSGTTVFSMKNLLP